MNQATSDYRDLVKAGQDLYRYAARLGFDRITHVQSRGPARPGGWTPVSIISEDSTRSIAIEDLPAHCPIGRFCLTYEKPFAWKYTDQRFFEPRQESAEDAASVDQFMRRFHVGGAVTTPVHLPANGVGIVSWLTSDADIDLHAIVERHGIELENHGRRLLCVARAFAETRPSLPAEALSPRELEILRWTALGKTSDEIGELISRSGETARFHLKSAIRKLGANNRIHAVARAAYYGLLADIY